MAQHTDANIHMAIAAVMALVGYVQKEQNSNLNYSYAGEAALIAAVRPAMVAHGIYVYPSGVEELTQTEYRTRNGTAMTRVTARFRFIFVHAPSNTTIEVEVLGEGADAGDKACNKAMTGALKYALRQTFCIETGDDPDRTSSEELARYMPPADSDQPIEVAGLDNLPATTMVSELTNAQMTVIWANWQTIAPDCDHINHFRNRVTKRFGTANLKFINTCTVQEFFETMAIPHAEYEKSISA